jgi:predicted ATPase
VSERSTVDDHPDWADVFGFATGCAQNVHVRLESLSIGGNEPLKIDPYGVTAIVGSNNSGKSTLLRQLRDVLSAGPQALQNDPVKLATDVRLNVAGSTADLFEWFTENAHFIAPNPGRYGRGTFQYGPHSVDVDRIERQWENLKSAGGLGDLAALFSFSADGDNRFQYAQRASARGAGTDPPSEPLHHLQDDRILLQRLSDLSQRVFNQPLTLDDSGSSVELRMGHSSATVPRLDESRREYARALAQLPTLENQGDGVRAFFSLFIPLIAATYSIVIVDEPEAFLHPPQAFAAGKALGEIAKASQVQVVLATHDKDFLAGVLASSAPLQIARLQRNGTDVLVRDVAASALQELWKERLLRYSNVLSGLFHRLVVICEAEQDCNFYQAALEDYLESRLDSDPVLLSASDVLFVPTNGKAAMAQVAKIVHAAGVPTVIVPDLDVLDDKAIISRMVRTLGGEWGDYDSDFLTATRPIKRRNIAPKVETLKTDLNDYLDTILSDDVEAVLEAEHKDKINRIMRAAESDWAVVKVAGISVFTGEQLQAANRILDGLATLGIVPVEIGSLESFAPEFPKNRSWLPSALGANAHRTEKAKSLVERILRGRFLT